MRRGNIGDDSEPGGRHLSSFDEAAAAHEVLLAPVAAFAARCEALQGFPIVNALQGAVDPPETQGHLNGINVTDYIRTVRFRAVDAQPEFGNFVVVLYIPLIQIRSRMNV